MTKIPKTSKRFLAKKCCCSSSVGYTLYTTVQNIKAAQPFSTLIMIMRNVT